MRYRTPALRSTPATQANREPQRTHSHGREGEFFKVGFSPRKASLVIYVMPGFDEVARLLEQLGPHKTGRSCLYVTRLARVDEGVLREIIQRSWAEMTARYD